MEILSSGSFVNLDNREKMEQLKITAQELANAASQTEGFVNSHENNRKLALEIWQGAEYMCRGHEEATIKNIFLSNFLEKLREIDRERPIQPQVAEPVLLADPPASYMSAEAVLPASSLSSDYATEVATPKDEYLGVVASNENPDLVQARSYSDECVPEGEADIAAIVESPASGVEEAALTVPQNQVLPEIKIADVAIPETPSLEITSTEQSADQTTAEPFESIVLKEKEPYHFDSCTVTAVIQLLPENTGVRKCVVSVRTHDFAPQISIVELRTGELFQDISRAFDEAFGRYRTDLPVKAADKIKKEKPANKKRSAKSNDGSKPSASTTAGDQAKDHAGQGETAAVPPAQATNAEQDQQNLFGS